MLEQFRRGLDGRREEASSIGCRVARVDEKLNLPVGGGVLEGGRKVEGRTAGAGLEQELELELEPEGARKKVCVRYGAHCSTLRFSNFNMDKTNA